MIKFFKIFAIMILFLNESNVVAQKKGKEIELTHLNIEKNEFLSIIDSTVLHERNCEYYDCRLIFSISVRKSENNFLISIESQKDINLLLSLNPNGYFYHQNHLFVLQGDQIETVFSACETKGIFKYLDYSHSYYHPKKGGKKTIQNLNDDSFSQWHYWFVNDNFVLEKKSTSCE